MKIFIHVRKQAQYIVLVRYDTEAYHGYRPEHHQVAEAFDSEGDIPRGDPVVDEHNF